MRDLRALTKRQGRSNSGDLLTMPASFLPSLFPIPIASSFSLVLKPAPRGRTSRAQTRGKGAVARQEQEREPAAEATGSEIRARTARSQVRILPVILCANPLSFVHAAHDVRVRGARKDTAGLGSGLQGRPQDGAYARSALPPLSPSDAAAPTRTDVAPNVHADSHAHAVAACVRASMHLPRRLSARATPPHADVDPPLSLGVSDAAAPTPSPPAHTP